MLPGKDQYVNLHAHRTAASPQEWVLTSVSALELPEPGDIHTPCSVGIHPWDVHKVHTPDVIKNLQQTLKNPYVLALGEAGLDKFSNAPLAHQERLFQQQLHLAVEAHIPVVIHSVRTHQNLIEIRKSFPTALSMVIHGFHGGTQIARSLVKAGFMLSVGAQLMQSKKLQKAICDIPEESWFLETDESDIPIDEMYRFAAQIIGTDLMTLKARMIEQAHHFFTKAS